MSAARAKGTAAETAVVRYLQAAGFPAAERRTMGGAKDRGDVAGVPGVCIEVKNHRTLDLDKWLDEATREALHAFDIGAVWHKRRMRADPGDWYVTMSGASFTYMLLAMQRLAQGRTSGGVR